MAEYKESEAIKRSIIECCGDLTEKDAEYIVDRIPTADVVPVVRCKDCRHFNGEGCLKTHGEFEPNLTDYCSYGERRCEE